MRDAKVLDDTGGVWRGEVIDSLYNVGVIVLLVRQDDEASVRLGHTIGLQFTSSNSTSDVGVVNMVFYTRRRTPR